MTPVLQLDDFRKKKSKKNDLSGPRYFCLSCDADVFKVMADGGVYCVSCTKKMNNLKVSA